MSKIVKNNTGSPVDVADTGQTIPASGQLTINPSNYFTWAESSDIVTLVGDGTLTINDGSTDLSISAGIDLIKGLYPRPPFSITDTAGNPINTVGGALPTASSCNSNLRLEHSLCDITLTSYYQTAYLYSGSGVLWGFILDFNTDYAEVKLTIDGTDTIFELDLDTIESLQSYAGNSCNDNQGKESALCGIISKTQGNRLNFCPPCPLSYTSEIKIEVKKLGSSSNRKLDKYFIAISKD